MKKEQYIKPKSNIYKVITSDLMDAFSVNQDPGGSQRSKPGMDWDWKDDNPFEEEEEEENNNI
jgi:hypothetical protein